jgi:ArsR family transcriptional regulator, arsenate/arsenite/antimonite-responsive transcriptional repressor
MDQTGKLFKALGEEIRLRILYLLLTEGELCVCDIMAALELPQSTASRHLAYLKKAGWVDDRREAVWMYYSIAKNTSGLMKEMIPLLKRHLASIPAIVSDYKRFCECCKNNPCA